MTDTKYVHIISHTHWDREWYLNSKYTNEWLVPFFDSLFSMMESESQYRFTLDGQTLMIEDYFEQLEIQGKDIEIFRNKLKKYVLENRLIVGPYYLQPDWQLISDEAIVRNLAIGHNMANEYGRAMNVGWLLDNFGQISQAPQIHSEFGMKGLFLWRGVEMSPEEINSEFLWESPDGTKMVSVYFLSSYRNAMRLAEYNDIMGDRIKCEYKKIAPFATTPNVLLMNGYDQEMVPDDILRFIKDGKMDFDNVKIIQSTPEDYIEAVKKYNPKLKQLKGALYSGRFISVFPGVLSCRVYLKLFNDICQKQLEKYAEPLNLIKWCLGGEYNSEKLIKSWKTLLKNHPHDSICGVSVDDVHTDMEERFGESLKLSTELIDHELNSLALNIDTSDCEDTLHNYVLFNTQLSDRNSVITINEKFDENIYVRDCDGTALPFQLNKKGSIDVFVHNIPALGYKTVYIESQEKNGCCINGFIPVQADKTNKTMENEFLKIMVNFDGTINAFDKTEGKYYSNLLVFEDGADSGDTYNYSYPDEDKLYKSSGFDAQIVFEENGPLKATIKINTVMVIPESLESDRKKRCCTTRELPIITWITLETGDPLLKIRTEIFNTVKDHRVRVLFRTDIESKHSYSDAPFDVVKRPISSMDFNNALIPDNVKRIIIGARESEPITVFSQKTFVDINDSTAGVAVISRGLSEYEIIEPDNTIALTLFRSVGWIARHDLNTRIGDAGPAITVPDAQCIRHMEFNYALYFHKGNWDESQVMKHADRFNSDILAVPTFKHDGCLKAKKSFARLKDNTGIIKVTAVKLSEDGKYAVIRMFNASDNDIKCGLEIGFNVKNAFYTDLKEGSENGSIILTEQNCLKVLIPPRKIRTIKIEVERETCLKTNEKNHVEWFTQGLMPKTDFSLYPPVELVSEEELENEEKRAKELECILAECEFKEKRYIEESGINMNEELEFMNKKELSKIRLEIETYKRSALEARLSAILLRRKYNTQFDEQNIDKNEIKKQLRYIGYQLNKVRVSKRVYEYIVDYYNEYKQ